MYTYIFFYDIDCNKILTKNWVWYFNGDRDGHMHRGRHFNDLFNMFDHVIRYFVWFFYMDGLVHSMNFFFNMNDHYVMEIAL